MQINDDTLSTSYKAFSMYLKSPLLTFIVLRAILLTVLFEKTLTNVAF